MKSANIEDIEAELKKSYEKGRMPCLEAWDKLRAKAEKAGVSWKDAKYVDADYTIREKKGFQRADSIRVTLSSGGQKHQFTIDAVTKIGNGWRTFDKLRWRRPSTGK